MSISRAYNNLQSADDRELPLLTKEHAETLKQAGHPLLAAHINYELSLIEYGVADRIREMNDALPVSDYDGIAGGVVYAFNLMTGKVGKDDAAYTAYEQYMAPIRLARENFGFDGLVPALGYVDRPEDILGVLEGDPEIQKVLNAQAPSAPAIPQGKSQAPGQRM